MCQCIFNKILQSLGVSTLTTFELEYCSFNSTKALIIFLYYLFNDMSQQMTQFACLHHINCRCLSWESFARMVRGKSNLKWYYFFFLSVQNVGFNFATQKKKEKRRSQQQIFKWCNRKSLLVKLQPCKVSNPTFK